MLVYDIDFQLILCVLFLFLFLVAWVSPNKLIFFSFAFLFFVSVFCFCFFCEMHLCASFFLLWCVYRCECVLRKRVNWIKISFYIGQYEEFIFYIMMCMHLGDCLMFLYRLPLVNYVSEEMKK